MYIAKYNTLDIKFLDLLKQSWIAKHKVVYSKKRNLYLKESTIFSFIMMFYRTLIFIPYLLITFLLLDYFSIVTSLFFAGVILIIFETLIVFFKPLSPLE